MSTLPTRAPGLAGRLALAGMGVAVLLAVHLHIRLSAEVSPLWRTLSEYVNAGAAPIFAVMCLALAAGSLALLTGIARARRGGAVPVLLGLWCAGLVVCGFFPVDPDGAARSLNGQLHNGGAVLAFVSLPIAGWLLTRRSPPDREIAPVTRPDREIAPVTRPEREIAPVTRPGREIAPVTRPDREIAPVTRPEREIAPVTGSGREIAPVTGSGRAGPPSGTAWSGPVTGSAAISPPRRRRGQQHCRTTIRRLSVASAATLVVVLASFAWIMATSPEDPVVTLGLFERVLFAVDLALLLTMTRPLLSSARR